MQDLSDYLSPINAAEFNDDNGYTDGQFAKHIGLYETEFPDLEDVDVVLVGINEMRGSGFFKDEGYGADVIRKQLYQLHYWHTDVKIADIGNVKTGVDLTDSYAALKLILKELLQHEKTVVILGGSHDITLAQYEAYKELDQFIEATCVDALINLRGESTIRSENFLLDMLTVEPNMIRHYNHIAFQSYFVHPRMLETMDKLRFDCYRVGVVRDNMDEMEPVMRNSNMLSFDISAIRSCEAPANSLSPNGLHGDEACMLSRYAGMSGNLSSFGIYGYNPDFDVNDLTARQISQMIWYFVDGKSKSKQESRFDDRSSFNEFHTAFAEIDTVFLQSKKTSRWWMQLPDKKFIACSYNDYLRASHNEIPERWLRVQERG